MARLASPFVDPLNSRPIRLTISDKQVCVTKSVVNVNWVNPPVTPLGYTSTLPIGTNYILATRDVLRPFTYPVINPPTMTKGYYWWYFLNDYAGGTAGGAPPMTIVRAGEALIDNEYRYGIPPIKNARTTYEDRFLPVVGALWAGLAPPCGMWRPGAVPADAHGAGRGPMFMFNGGEFIQVGVAVPLAVPAGFGLILTLDLVRFDSNLTSFQVLERLDNGLLGSEYVVTIPAGTAAYTYINFYMNLQKCVAASGTTGQESPHIGYLGIRLKEVECAVGTGTYDPQYVAFRVNQFYPTFPATLNTGASNTAYVDTTYDMTAVQGSNTPCIMRMYPHAVWYQPPSPAVADMVGSSLMAEHRTSASCLLATNIGQNMTREGLVSGCRLPSSVAIENIDEIVINSLAATPGPASYSGPMARGAYTWFRPPEASELEFNPGVPCVMTSYGSSIMRMPIIVLNDNTSTHILRFADGDPSTPSQFLLRSCTHFEFVPSYPVFSPSSIDGLTQAAMDELRLTMRHAGEFTENWTHIAELWNMIKQGAINVAKAGLGAASSAAMHELALAAATVLL